MRLRDLVGLTVGLLVVAGLAYGGWVWLSSALEPDEPDPAADATEVAQAYATAWEAGDHAAMASLLRSPPDDLDARLQQLRDGLEASSLTVALGEADAGTEGRALVPLTISVTSALLDEPVAWDAQLLLLRERGTWGVEWSLSSIHPELRATWEFGSAVEEVDREEITAVDGTPLAGPGEQVMLGFHPASTTDPQRLINAFGRAVPGSEAAAERELRRTNLVADWFYPVVTVTPAQADRARPTLRGIPGFLERRQGTPRQLLEEGFAQHVVGLVREATAEQLEQLGEAYQRGDVVGQFGLEQVFESQLVGSERTLVGLREASGGALQVVVGQGQRNPSRPVHTTIDLGVQRAIEEALDGETRPAAIVVVDAATGAIAGSASRPLDAFNRAFSGRYPPGSTFKIVTAEALLGSGMTPDDPVACPARTLVGGLAVPNAGNRSLGDDATLARAFAASCNTTFATLGAGLGGDALGAAAERFGFGVDPLVPLAAFGGSFPAPRDTAEAGAASFGQARVEASPLHLASVAAAAISGTWRQPYLLVEDGPGEQRPLATGSRDALRAMLREAVEDGTGERAAVDGEVVLGKTGTAQAAQGPDHAWFLGAWGELGFAVLVEGGGAGSDVAAPLAARLVEGLATFTSGEGDPLAPDDGEGGGGDG